MATLGTVPVEFEQMPFDLEAKTLLQTFDQSAKNTVLKLNPQPTSGADDVMMMSLRHQHVVDGGSTLNRRPDDSQFDHQIKGTKDTCPADGRISRGDCLKQFCRSGMPTAVLQRIEDYQTGGCESIPSAPKGYHTGRIVVAH